MKKYPIGFNMRTNKEPENETQIAHYQKTVQPKKSVVQIYFPHRGTGWAYYNDSYDLKVGDFVYVEGKLEGTRGHAIVEGSENYEDERNGYFAIISKEVFMNTVMNKKVSGKISLGV